MFLNLSQLLFLIVLDVFYTYSSFTNICIAHFSSGESTPVSICTGHDLPVACVDVNSSLGIIASGSVGE